MFKILIVEDDANTRRLMGAILKANGYQPLMAEDGEQALEVLDHEQVDLLIVDIMMPNLDGYQLTEQLRAAGSTLPILMVTARQSTPDKRQGFLVGTDDYMVKPVNVNEMILRINALLKRAQIVNEKKIRFENAELHFDDLTVCIDGDCNVLPQKEFYILYKLLSNPNRVFTKQQIMDEIWGMDTESDPHTLDVHISRLRERFKDTAQFEIVTIRGLGYKAVKKNG